METLRWVSGVSRTLGGLKDSCVDSQSAASINNLTHFKPNSQGENQFKRLADPVFRYVDGVSRYPLCLVDEFYASKWIPCPYPLSIVSVVRELPVAEEKH